MTTQLKAARRRESPVDGLGSAVRSLRDTLAVPNIPDRAASLLEQLIVSGQIKPGARIIEESLASDLGISRTSLREALIYLEKAGLIAREGKTKRVVRTVSRTDVLELYEMWAILESEAAAAACAVAGTDALIDLQRLLDEMDAAPDRASYQVANLEFHRSLTTPCPNATLLDAYLDCLKKIRWAWALLIPRHGGRDETGQDHRVIFDAYAARDANKVRELVRMHLFAGRASFLSDRPKRAAQSFGARLTPSPQAQSPAGQRSDRTGRAG